MVQTQDIAAEGPAIRLPQARDVLDSLADIVFQTDAAGHWTYLNPAWTAVTGFSVESTLGTNFLDYVHPDEREHTIALFMAVVAGGADHCHHRTRYRTSDGGYRWVDLRAKLMFDDAGQIVGNSGTITDVTERRSAEESVAEHGQLLELVTRGADFDDLPVGVVVLGPDETVRRSSPVAERLLGAAASPGAPIGKLLCLLAPDPGGAELRGEWGLIATVRRTGRPQYGDVRVSAAPGGRQLSFHVSVLPLGDSHDADPSVALVLHDVTDLRRAERQQAAVARLGQRGLSGIPVAELLDEAVAAVAETLETSHCEVLELLPGRDGWLARAALGWADGVRGIAYVPAEPPVSLLAGTIDAGGALAVEDLRGDPGLAAHGWLSGAGIQSSLSVVVHGGDQRPFGILAAHTRAPRAWSSDEVDFLQAVANVLASAIERRRAEEETRHQALHDPLTGLANRVLLQDRLEQALRARRRTAGVVALLLMDLDRFKEINDTLGHDVGDEVLRVVGSRLQNGTREADTVVRLGGDEFALVMPTANGVEDAMAVAHKMRSRISELIDHHGVPLRVEATVGIAIAPQHGQDPIALLKRADVAMYRAKHLAAGVAVYSRESDENHPERLAYFAELREAIAGDQLLLYYQPKVDLHSGRTTAVEALVRWRHPVRGLIPPDQFIPLAERTGLIQPLTWRVLSLALEQARRWRRNGWPVPVAVNVSARVLHDPDLIRRVLGELTLYGVPAEALELEVTESAVMASPVSAMAVATSLREHGVRLSLDDFGTGYSSLAYLRDLPVQQLKIDRSFVRRVTKSHHDASIVRSVIDLGHNLDLRVVGEGIESREAYQLLRDLGCDEGQGYYIGRPAPAAQLRVPSEGPAPG
jgi:diguanylate cyclase (GGDEF)-like protein/PAS domain S-box-containing protein